MGSVWPAWADVASGSAHFLLNDLATGATRNPGFGPHVTVSLSMVSLRPEKMARVQDEKLGTPAEYELRDDDRPNATSYQHDHQRTISTAFLLLGILLAGLILGYIYYDRDTYRVDTDRFGAIAFPARHRDRIEKIKHSLTRRFADSQGHLLRYGRLRAV